MTENPLDKIHTPGNVKIYQADLEEDILARLQDNDWKNDPTPIGVKADMSVFDDADSLREQINIRLNGLGRVSPWITEKLKLISDTKKLKEILRLVEYCQSIDEFEARFQ